MISRTCRMVASGVDGGRYVREPLDSDCDILAVGADHRQVQDGDLHACGVAPNAAQCRCRMSILAGSTAWSDGRLQPSACSATILSVRRSPEPPTMIGTSLTGRG